MAADDFYNILGTNPFGEWKLEIFDDYDGDEGQLDEWCIQEICWITIPQTETPTLTPSKAPTTLIPTDTPYHTPTTAEPIIINSQSFHTNVTISIPIDLTQQNTKIETALQNSITKSTTLIFTQNYFFRFNIILLSNRRILQSKNCYFCAM